MIGTAPRNPTQEINSRELNVHLFKGKEAEQDTERAGEDNHENADQGCRYGDGQHFMGIHQQSQAQEHDNLEEPGHAAHKSSDLLTVYNACVTHHHPCYIDSQIAVSFTQVGHGECEENKSSAAR